MFLSDLGLWQIEASAEICMRVISNISHAQNVRNRFTFTIIQRRLSDINNVVCVAGFQENQDSLKYISWFTIWKLELTSAFYYNCLSKWKFTHTNSGSSRNSLLESIETATISSINAKFYKLGGSIWLVAKLITWQQQKGPTKKLRSQRDQYVKIFRTLWLKLLWWD